jgi:hypothetical protein
MGVGQPHGDLEVLAPEGEGDGGGGESETTPTPPTPIRRRRWPAMVLAVVVVASAVAFVSRANLARRQLPWLQRQWAQALADDGERFTAEQHLNRYRAVTDASPLDADIAVLYREEQRRFGAIHGRVHRALLVDPGLSALRSDIQLALDHRGILLAHVADWYEHPTAGPPPLNADDQTAADMVRINDTLRGQQVRWGDHGAAPTVSAPPYSGVSAALAHLSHWLDQPVGVVLVSGSASPGQIVGLEVDASREVALPPAGDYPTLRRGYLAYVSASKVWAVAPDGSGAPRLLADGEGLFPADDPGAIWVVDTLSSTVTEFDGTGRVLLGPRRPPGSLNMATSAGLVVVGPYQPGIAVWNPAAGAFGCRFNSPNSPNSPSSPSSPNSPNSPSYGNGQPLPLAARGNLLAWASNTGQLHLSDASSCVDRTPAIANTTQGGLQGAAAFSSDGRRLAVASYRQDPQGKDTYTLSLVDVASASVTDVPITETATAPISAVAWTPDGTRLFWMYSGLFGSSSRLETWRLGDPVARPLRAIGLALAPPLYVVP